MDGVKIFHCFERGLAPWRKVGEFLEEFGIMVYHQSEPAIVSIVLGGLYENSLALTGKKILVYNRKDWFNNTWPLYEFVLEEYYDEMIDVTDNGVDEIARLVVERVREVKKYRNQD